MGPSSDSLSHESSTIVALGVGGYRKFIGQVLGIAGKEANETLPRASVGHDDADENRCQRIFRWPRTRSDHPRYYVAVCNAGKGGTRSCLWSSDDKTTRSAVTMDRGQAALSWRKNDLGFKISLGSMLSSQSRDRGRP